ncbi:NRDE-2, necessary for RNA interference-domain-containing protein [Chytridium lagenaria]|nr:NRDE-2, necessary for RNA interference-domain-containing protein [Chytridium lagenaria]
MRSCDCQPPKMTERNKSPPRGFLGSSLFPNFKVQSDDDDEDNQDKVDANLYRNISTIQDPAPIASKPPSSFPSFPSFSSAPKFPSFSSFQAPTDKPQERRSPEVIPQLTSDFNVFYIDRKGDANLLRYEGLSKKEVSDYRRSYFTILGPDFDYKIDKHSGKMGRGFAVTGRPKKDRIGYDEFKKQLKARPIKVRSVIKPKNTSEPYEPEDFIPLDQELLSGSRELDKAEKTEEFNKRINSVSSHMNVFCGWIFIKFQDTLVDSVVKKALKRAKAFAHFPNDDELFGGTTKLLTKWDKILKQHAGSFLLWERYLEFRQTNYTTFSVLNCLEVYEECISALSKNQSLDHAVREGILAHIFTRACFMLAQSGFIERAICCFQAMIEFSSFCPQAFEEQPFQDRVEIFELFWESECPRFGEEGAIGWSANFMQSTSKSVQTKLPPKVTMTDEEGEDEFQKWFREESIAEYRLWLPLRSLAEEEVDEEEESDDPYRSVIFTDIRPLMFPITLRSTKRQLIGSFLNLLSSQINFGISSKDRLTADPFLHGEFVGEACAAAFFPEVNKMNVESHEETAKRFKFPLKSFPSNSRNVRGEKEYFGMFDEFEAVAVEAAGDDRRNFVRNVFVQARPVLNEDFKILPALFGFEVTFGLKSGMKFGKNLLKSERFNLSLWCVYADIEASRGNHAEALKIFQTALKSYRSFPKEHQSDAPSLHFAFAEYLFKQGSNAQALNVLVFLFDTSSAMDIDAPMNPTRLLKARKGYQDLTQNLINIVDANEVTQGTLNAASSIGCHALLEYLSQALDDGLSIYDAALTTLRFKHTDHSSRSSGTVFEEMLLEHRVRLIYLHSQCGSGGFRPVVLREALEESLTAYPNHAGLLMMFLHNEARTKIENRLRRFLDGLLVEQESHILWTFSIWAELHQRTSYNVNSVRSLFERAVDSNSGRHNPSLWYLYIVFEVISSSPAVKVKAVFFRAIRECPWVKAIYMLPFSTLRFAFEVDELAEVHALMEEKELRVRCQVG